MREILFRGRRINGYGWETGDLIHNGDERFTMTFIGGIAVSRDKYTDEISFDGHWLAEVDPSTVGQYTGLKDRNGKKIFEGDIIKIPDDYDQFGQNAGEKYQVIFRFGGFRLKPKYSKNAKGYWLEDDKTVEVIGNIYDNPALLEV